MTQVTILLADSDNESRLLLKDCLKKAGHKIVEVKNGEDALITLQKQQIDILIADLNLPKLDGLGLLEKMRSEKSDTTVLLITGDASVITAIKAIKLGAEDYLTKPLNLDELKKTILKITAGRNSSEKNDSQTRLQQKVSSGFENIIGTSDAMQKLFRLIDKIASADSTVLIFGESGTGKELVARAIHNRSHRAANLLVPVNCGAIPEELLESELFGHEKGSFTSAYKMRVGRFELACSGTIFLDEIGDMSPNLQVKILRVLQEHEFERVGGVKPIKADIRVIAATHRDLEKAVAEGKFREDLFYRLNVIPLIVPPLRERISDIPLLVAHFIQTFNREKGMAVSGVSDTVMACFLRYSWPGNVRELQNLMERFVILKDTGCIDVEDLPEKLIRDQDSAPKPSGEPISDETTFTTMVTNFEKRLILQALRKSEGVKNKAAKLLNMNRTTLVEKMKKLQI
ncbi:MAG: sigma-54 dependent transcriptional regulator [Pseudomonadota bacterium]